MCIACCLKGISWVVIIESSKNWSLWSRYLCSKMDWRNVRTELFLSSLKIWSRCSRYLCSNMDWRNVCTALFLSSSKIWSRCSRYLCSNMDWRNVCTALFLSCRELIYKQSSEHSKHCVKCSESLYLFKACTDTSYIMSPVFIFNIFNISLVKTCWRVIYYSLDFRKKILFCRKKNEKY